MLSRGLTLIELLTVLAILGLLLVAGAPMLTDAIKSARIRSVAAELSASLQAARAVALRNNNSATYRLATGGSWTAALPDGTVAKSGQIDYTARVSLNPATATLTFTSLGGTAFRAFDVQSTTASDCRAAGGDVACLRVEVLGGGAARVCDPSVTAGSSDYACSP